MNSKEIKRVLFKNAARLGLAAGLGFAAQSAHAADFYAGKTITFIAGQTAGGGADLACRMIAQFIGKYIPGHPDVIVKNMPSTNDVISDNYVGKEAKKDGLTLACGPYGPDQQLFHDPGFQVDFTKFQIISGDGESQVVYVRSDVPPGIKTGADIFKINPADLTYGGYTVSALKDISSRAFLAVMGLDNYKYVTGFTGDSAGRAAVQQKFVNIWNESMTSYVQITGPTMEKTGMIVSVAQAGNLDANGKRIRDPREPDLPTYGELYQAHFGKPPSGPAWEVLDLVVSNVNVALDWLALPPGSPPEAVTLLRAAIGPLNQDPDFIAASAKLRGPGKLEQPGTLVQKSIADFLAMPPDVFSYYQDLVKSGTSMQQKNK